ncbi:MAG TPA: acyl-CoA dehydrogenase family protein [Alphaproteobacteria bacterium]|nr:acyl-CoA dehydrogenase family protein [Alphaproteobacteria bacterium]
MDVRERFETAGLRAFRAQVRNFVRTALPDDIRRKVAQERMDLPREDQQRWHKILRAQGWACPGWPREHGGPGFDDDQRYVLERELALGDAPRSMIYGEGMLGPTVMAYGTEAQKRRILPGILEGDVLWCQGFSEPNAGSDLAALQCKAERRSDADGEHYILNGTKMWTSEGHIADWMFGLFRTDNSGRKQEGITFLVLDLKSPGVTIRPILLFEGTHEVNQVFFDNVRVPLENRLGDEHKGWGIAKYLLSLERFGTAEVSRSMASLARLKRFLRTQDPFRDAPGQKETVERRVAELEMELEALEITEVRFLFQPEGANAIGPEASMLKVRGTEIQGDIFELAMMCAGAHALSARRDESGADTDATARGQDTAYPYFNFRKTLIYAGSNEIQRNIIAKAVLGL